VAIETTVLGRVGIISIGDGIETPEPAPVWMWHRLPTGEILLLAVAARRAAAALENRDGRIAERVWCKCPGLAERFSLLPRAHPDVERIDGDLRKRRS